MKSLVLIFSVALFIASHSSQSAAGKTLECVYKLSNNERITQIFEERNGELSVDYFHVSSGGKRQDCCKIKVDYYRDGFFIFEDTEGYLMGKTFGYIDFSSGDMGSLDIFGLKDWVTGVRDNYFPSWNGMSTGGDYQCRRLD